MMPAETGCLTARTENITSDLPITRKYRQKVAIPQIISGRSIKGMMVRTEQLITHGLNLLMTSMETGCPLVQMERNT